MKHSSFLLKMLCVGLCALLFAACASNSPEYVKNSSHYTSLSIDSHDIEDMLKKAIDDFKSSHFLKSLKKDKKDKDIVLLSDFVDKSGEDLDMELIARKLSREMRKVAKFDITNALAGSGGAVDKGVHIARGEGRSEEFDEKSTIEKGNLKAPNLSLSGKITSRKRKISENTHVEYTFIFTLTDIKSGVVKWDFIDKVEKKIRTDLANEYKGSEKLALHEEDNSESKREKPKEKEEVSSKNWRFFIGGELGAGAGKHASIIPQPYGGVDGGSISINNKPKDKDDDDDGREIDMSLPMALRVGVSGGKNFFWSLSALYLRYNRDADENRIVCSGNSRRGFEGGCPSYVESKIGDGVSYKNEMLGANLRLGLGNGGSGGLYLGGGMLWDLRSRVSGFSGDLAFSREIKGRYPFAEFGIMVATDGLYLDLNYRYIMEGEKNQDWANIGSLNLGIGLAL